MLLMGGSSTFSSIADGEYSLALLQFIHIIVGLLPFFTYKKKLKLPRDYINTINTENYNENSFDSERK